MGRTALSAWWMPLALGTSLYGAACGGESAPPPAATMPREQDAGYISGSEPYDAAVPLPRKDAGPLNIPAGEPEDGLSGSCAVDSNKIYTVAERSTPFTSTPLAVDRQSSQFMVPYVDSGECLDAVHMATLASAAASGEPSQQVTVDMCALVREAAATSLGDRWLIATTDNREAPYDVWVTPYDADAQRAASAQRISESSAVETAVALAALSSGDAALVAYADEDLGAGQSLHVRLLDSDGRPSAEPVRIDSSTELYYTALTIKPLGSGAGISYVRYSLDYKTSDIVFVALDAQGKPVRDPWVLAGNAGPNPSVGIAADSDGGGIVYSRAEASTGRQIWFQQIDTDGQAALQRTGTTRAPALRIVNSPHRGIDVSMTKLRATFILAYRELPEGEATRATLRTYFLDRYGAVVGSSDVSYTSLGGRTAIESSIDGRVALAWNELLDTGASALKVARMPCLGN